MEIPKLSPKAFALAGGFLWASALLVVGVLNLVFPGYGKLFLDVAGSVYFFYPAEPSLGSVLVLTGIAFLDGAIAGLIFAGIYNFFALRCCRPKSE